MKKTFYILLSLLLVSIYSFSQNEAKNWILGSNIKINFETSPPTFSPILFNSGNGVYPDPGFNIENSSSISDANGKLLFYVVGKNLYNGFNNSIVTSSLATTLDASQGSLIIPKPNTDNQYFLFTVDASPSSCGNFGESGSNRGANLYTVTVNADNSLVTVSTATPLSGSTSAIEGQTIAPSSEADEYWYIVHETGNSNFKIYKISESGASLVTTSNVGPNSPGCSFINYKFNSCYTKLAVATFGQVTIYDFNNTTGVLSNARTTTQAGAYGLEFSPNGNYLYVQTSEISSPQILRFTPSASSMGSSTLIASVSSVTQNKMGHLQLGPDGVIYQTRKNSYSTLTSNSEYIGAITNPDGTTPTFTQNYIKIYDQSNFGNNTISLGMGLPNIPTFLVTNLGTINLGGIGIEKNIVCIGDTKDLSHTFTGSADWKITSPSKIITTSTGATWNGVTFSEQGTYKIQITITDNCGAKRSLSRYLKVFPIQTADATQTLVCPNAKLVGNGSASGLYKWYTKNPASGGIFIKVDSVLTPSSNITSVWVEPASELTSSVSVTDSRKTSFSGSTTGATTITTSAITKISQFSVTFGNISTAGNLIIELKDAQNNIIGTPISKAITTNNTFGTINITASDWVVLPGTYTVSLSSNSATPTTNSYNPLTFSNTDINISGGRFFAFVCQTQKEGINNYCKIGKTINITCCTPQLNSTLTPNTTCKNIAFVYNPTTLTNGVTFTWTRASVNGISNTAVTSASSALPISETLNNFTGSLIDVKYKIKLTSGCAISDTTVTVSVNPVIPAMPTISGNTPICPTQNLALTASTTTIGTINWTWTKPANSTAVAGVGIDANKITKQNIVNNDLGTYTVTATINGCTSQVETAVVSSPTLAQPTIVGATNLCLASNLLLSASTSDLGTTTWTWTKPVKSTATQGLGAQSNTIGKNNILADEAGNYTVTANINGCVSPSKTVTLSVQTDIPQVYFSPLTQEIASGATMTPITIALFPSNATYDLTSVADNFVTGNSNGTNLGNNTEIKDQLFLGNGTSGKVVYTVTPKQGVCIGQSLNHTVTVTSLLTSLQNDNEVKYQIYPNPVKNTLFISTNSPIIEDVVIYDLFGNELINSNTIANHASINVKNLSTGLYLLKFKTGDSITTYKFVKE